MIHRLVINAGGSCLSFAIKAPSSNFTSFSFFNFQYNQVEAYHITFSDSNQIKSSLSNKDLIFFVDKL